MSGWPEIREYCATGAAWPDLLLIDFMLGEDGTGIDVARRLQPEVPMDRVVLVTGNTVPDQLRDIRESGFSYLTKPAATEDLKAILAGCQSR